MDISEVEGMDPSQRRMLTERLAEDEELNARICRGLAMVFDSAMLRGILTAVWWVKKPPYPQKVFKNVEQAKAWCVSQMAGQSASVSSAM
jgi:hypothetical protein